MQRNINKNDLLVVGFICFFSLGLYFYNSFKYRNFEKNALYTSGKVVEKTTGKNGSYYKCNFVIEGATYYGKFSQLALNFEIGDIVLIKFQKSNPSVNSVMYEYMALPEFTHEIVSTKVWDQIPLNLFRCCR